MGGQACSCGTLAHTCYLSVLDTHVCTWKLKTNHVRIFTRITYPKSGWLLSTLLPQNQKNSVHEAAWFEWLRKLLFQAWVRFFLYSFNLAQNPPVAPFWLTAKGKILQWYRMSFAIWSPLSCTNVTLVKHLKEPPISQSPKLELPVLLTLLGFAFFHGIVTFEG